MGKLKLYSILTILLLLVTSCSSSAKLVVSDGTDLSKYTHVKFGKELDGDRELDDVIMLVQNEIAKTNLKVASNDVFPVFFTLSPHINVVSEKWDGGHTFITITFYDYTTDQMVAVIKSSGIGLSISQDQNLALGAIRKKLQAVFGKKQEK